ncbi:uncharacterized protein LOC126905991 isoform X3 [Daktulosphaira vitifoliae]|uniref:uncharacterized protein LOC126905991 isoform X3 n=1 Tax=Daktulosphaira vitifoliae TaxID=58002 RepID=UPI0021AAA22E|nr:uncharacterized protein LOC126905991 isoform X3 [Daktulosphaira vitifoliae]
MHLKTILIFCSVCFFTDTMSYGLNAIQIQCLQVLVKKYNDKDKVNKVIKAFNVKEEYDYNTEDNEYKRVYKILYFMHKYDKVGDSITLPGDQKEIIKLDKNELERVFGHFRELGLEDIGFIDYENYYNLINSIDYSDLLRNDDLLNDWKSIIREEHKYDLGDVMIKLLEFQSQFFNLRFGKVKYLKTIQEFIEYILRGGTPDQKIPILQLLLNVKL